MRRTDRVLVVIVEAISASTRRRVRVLVVRQRLERAATALLVASEGDRAGPRLHQYVKHRLLLLTTGVRPELWRPAYELARRAGYVYRDTSQVLHSNRAFADVPEMQVREWEEVADEVDAAVAQRSGDH